jgi:hypothetical protein
MLRFDDVVQVSRRVTVEDGAGAVTVHRLADELAVGVDAVRVLAVDTTEFVRAAADCELSEIAAAMSAAGDWTERLVDGIADTILVSRNYMTAGTSLGTGLALGPGVVAWMDAVITLLERADHGDDEWLFRAYRLVTSVTIGAAYTFRDRDGRQLDRASLQAAVRRLVFGLAAA